MTREELREAIFGSFDGLTSVLGVITGALAAGAATGAHILGPAIGLAVAATLGMAAGRYLEDPVGQRRLHLAVVMGVFTMLGSSLPAVPFVTGAGRPQVVAMLVITAVGGVLIGSRRGYLLTFALLVAVGALTAGLSAVVA